MISIKDLNLCQMLFKSIICYAPLYIIKYFVENVYIKLLNNSDYNDYQKKINIRFFYKNISDYAAKKID